MSSSLLSNKYLNKLDVNRLQVNELKVGEVLPKIDSETKSYLYSVILNNAEFLKVENDDYNAELTINVSEQLEEVIQFIDRPFTSSGKITIQQFVELFLLKEPDSFAEVPPNVVLSFNNVQKSYKMSLASELNNQVIFNLKLLDGEEHSQDNFIGTINMFVDNDENTTMNTKYYSAKITIYNNDDYNFTILPNTYTSNLQAYLTIKFMVYSNSFNPNLMRISLEGTDYSEKELSSSLSNSTLTFHYLPSYQTLINKSNDAGNLSQITIKNQEFTLKFSFKQSSDYTFIDYITFDLNNIIGVDSNGNLTYDTNIVTITEI